MQTSAVFRASWDRQSLCYRDARIKAALICAPAPPLRAFTEASLQPIRVPIQIFVGGDDQEAPAEDCALWLHERLPTSTLTTLGAAVGHYAFLAEATPRGRERSPDICLDAPGVVRKAIHDQVAAAAIDRFRSP